jgi:hypothetical protein
VFANPHSSTKVASAAQSSDVGTSYAGKTSRAAVTTARPPSVVPPSSAARPLTFTAPPPSFAELSKYSQQMVIELANTQQSEAQSSAKFAQRDLLRLRDYFQKVSSAESSAKQLAKANSLRLATRSQSSLPIHDSKQLSHLSEPTPPRSRRPVPNTAVSVSKPAHSSNAGVYDIDDADASTPLRCAASATITPKLHRPASMLLPSVSPFFQTPERTSNSSISASRNHAFSTLPSPVAALHIPLPAVDSVPSTPRPSTPPQPIQNHPSLQNSFSLLIPHHNEMIPVSEDSVKFKDLEAPQAPPYPDMFIDRSAHDSPHPGTVARVETPHFESLFELTNDLDHDVFAAISALSAPLESLVNPQSRFDPKQWLSVIDTDADIAVRVQRMKAAHLVVASLVQKDETEVKSSFKRLNELRVDLLWQTKRRQLRFWLNSSGHTVLGPRKREVVMKFLGLTPASRHAKSISIKEPSPGCPGLSVEKRWQGSDFKIQLMLSLVSKYQLHLAFVQFKMNSARARAIRHVSACLTIANGRRYILLGWCCLKSWHSSRLLTRDVAVRSGSNKWFFFLQIVLRSWSRFVSSRIKRQRSLAHFQHNVDARAAANNFKRWSSSVKIRQHGAVLSSSACQLWYLTCSLRCMLRWWQGTQILVARKRALRAFAGSNSGNLEDGAHHLPSEGALKPRSSLSKTELDEQLRLKQMLAVRRRKQLLAPLKMYAFCYFITKHRSSFVPSLLQQKKLAVSALSSIERAPDPLLSRKAGPTTSDVAISAAARRLFFRTFIFWKEASATSSRAKDLTRKIALHCKNRTFIFWKYIVALHRGFSSLATRMQYSCSKRALSLWLYRARLEKHSLQSISNRCRLRLLHSVVSSWKIVGHIDALASDWRVKRHFALWLRALPIIWSDQEKEGIRLNQLRATRSTFHRWRSCVQRNKRLLALLLRGQLLYCKHLLVVVWTSWKLATTAASLRSGTTKRLSLRRKMRELGYAFGCWTSHLHNIRLLRRVFRAAAERWHVVFTLNVECVRSDVHIMADHFCCWRLDAKAVKKERLLKSIYATAVVYQSIRRRRTILHSWSRWAYCRLSARKQFERARLTLLRGLLSVWASLAVVTKALTRRVEVRQRRKRLEGCIVSMRAAARFGRCRRGPLARRCFSILKWYCQMFCRDQPQQHRSGVLQRLVMQAWSSQRLMSLKVALCVVTTSRCVLRRKFTAWMAHTGDRKRAIISHRLANAHSAYATKKRVFCALKRQLADAARHFFLLGKAVIFNSRRCLYGGFQLWKAAAAMQREQRLAPHPSPSHTASSLPFAAEAPLRTASVAAVLQTQAANTITATVEEAAASLRPRSSADALLLDARPGATAQTVSQSFRAIPVTESQGSSTSASGLVPLAPKAAESRQRVFRENVAPRRASALQPSASVGKVVAAARANHGTQTLAAPKPHRPPLVVETVPQRAATGGRGEGVVVGRAVVSSFLLADRRL